MKYPSLSLIVVLLICLTSETSHGFANDHVHLEHTHDEFSESAHTEAADHHQNQPSHIDLIWITHEVLNIIKPIWHDSILIAQLYSPLKPSPKQELPPPKVS